MVCQGFGRSHFLIPIDQIPWFRAVRFWGQSGHRAYAIKFLKRCWMMFDPVLRNFLSPGDPDIFLLDYIIEEALQAGGAAGMARNTQVEPNGHHLGLFCALAQHQVESIFGIGEEIVAGREERPRLF